MQYVLIDARNFTLLNSIAKYATHPLVAYISVFKLTIQYVDLKGEIGDNLTNIHFSKDCT